MYKFILSVAGIGAALAIAAPADAQYYPAPPNAPGYGYGLSQNNWREIREMRFRIENIRRQIEGLDHNDVIGGHSADRLLDQANKLDRRLSDRARRGLDPREAGDIRYRIQRLEQQVQWASAGRLDRDRGWR